MNPIIIQTNKTENDVENYENLIIETDKTKLKQPVINELEQQPDLTVDDHEKTKKNNPQPVEPILTDSTSIKSNNSNTGSSSSNNPNDMIKTVIAAQEFQATPMAKPKPALGKWTGFWPSNLKVN